MKYALTIWGLAFAILLAGCATGPDPSEILNRSHDAMREVQSYRFSGESESKIQGEVMGGRQSGAWAAPDQWYVKLEFLGDHAGQGGETLVVGQRVYNREFDSNDGAWREVTHLLEGQAVYNPRPESNLAVPDLENLRLREDVVVDGRATFQVTGEQRETRTLGERFPPRPEGDEVEWITRYTWLITKEHYLLVRSTVEQDTGLGRATHRTTTTSYDYNQPVVIEVPELSGK